MILGSNGRQWKGRGMSVTLTACPEINLQEKTTVIYPMGSAPMSKSKSDQTQFCKNISLLVECTYLILLEERTFYTRMIDL